MKVTGKQWNAVKEQVVPLLEDWYSRHALLLSSRGKKLVPRALSKGTLASEKGALTLFGPAFLIGTKMDADGAAELAAICDRVPFSGDYSVWDPIRGVYALSCRALVTASDVRATEVEQHLSFAENGEVLAPPVIDDAMTNRVNGRLLEPMLTHQLPSPITLPWLAFATGVISELAIMWAYGGSESWPRERIDSEIERIEHALSEFYAN